MARLPDPPATVIVNAIADVVGAQPCARATVHVLDRLHEAGWGFARHDTLAAAAALLGAMIERFGLDPAETVVTIRDRDAKVLEVTLADWILSLDHSRGGTDPRLPVKTAP